MKTPQLGHLSPSSSQPQQILARHGKSFYWASKFLGADLAERAAQLYLFCRYVDDLADGDLPDRQESLEDIRARLDGKHVSAGPEIEAFIKLADTHNIPLSAAAELLDGMLRDVLEDAQMDRRYLPSSWVNFTPQQIAEAGVNCQQPVAYAITRLLNLSEQYYASAQLGIRLLPFRSRLSIAIALRVYRQIGWVLKRRNMVWWQGRVMVTAGEKVLLSLRSMADLRPKVVPPHETKLHHHLQGLAGVQPR